MLSWGINESHQLQLNWLFTVLTFVPELESGMSTLKMMQRSSQKAQEMCTLNFGFDFTCESPIPNRGSVV